MLDGDVEACAEVARATGVLLDPVYTLAGFEVASDLASRETGDRTVAMLHTGGTLGLMGVAQRHSGRFVGLHQLDAKL